MAFETLLNKPFSEPDLLEAVITEVRANFAHYQNEAFFLKLGALSPTQSQVVWIRPFVDIYAMSDFFWTAPTYQTNVCVQFDKTRQCYRILLYGFHFVGDCEIFVDRVRRGPADHQRFSNKDAEPMPPIEKIEMMAQGFAEIAGELAATPKGKMSV